VHIFITRGNKLSIITSEQETFAYVRLMFSTVCKNNSSMHSELIIQVKYMRELTYLKRDQSATTSNFYLFFIFYFFYIKETCNMEMTSYAKQNQT
jgi:hypothetical protein